MDNTSGLSNKKATEKNKGSPTIKPISMKAIGKFFGPKSPTKYSERTKVALLFATILPNMDPRIIMGIIEPNVPPIPFCMAAMVCSVVNDAAIPKPSETTRNAIKGCIFMTEMRVTKTNIAAQIRSQMLIFFRMLE